MRGCRARTLGHEEEVQQLGKDIAVVEHEPISGHAETCEKRLKTTRAIRSKTTDDGLKFGKNKELRRCFSVLTGQS